MENPNRNNKIIKFLMIFLLVVLFPNCSYSIQKNEEIPKQVIVGGELLQCDIKTSKLMFYTHNNPSYSLKNYDLLESLEGKVIEDLYNKSTLKNITKEDILKINLRMEDNDKVNVKIKRNGISKDLVLSKKEIHHSFFVDKVPFSATLTYINPLDNTFGAVGHNMHLNKDKEILSKSGNIYLCNLSELKSSNKDEVGYMHGNTIFKSQGNIINISEVGARGKINGKEILTNKNIYDVGYTNEVKKGCAQLLIKDNFYSEKVVYDIEIINLNKKGISEPYNFEFKVIDKDLIDNYGGIVQGMSGSPIIQNGKIIGALSHVTCNDTTKGMAVYIQRMMED